MTYKINIDIIITYNNKQQRIQGINNEYKQYKEI